MNVRLLVSFFVCFSVVFPLWGTSAFSQSLNLSSQKEGNNVPIEVFADNGIEWMQNEKLFIARGNAKAVRDGVTVTGDTLKAYYREKPDGENEIFRLDADGNVTIATATETVTGNAATYNVDDSALIMRGSPARLVTPTDTVIAYDRLEYWEREGKAVARGNATALRDDKRIQADVLEAFFGPGPEKENELKTAHARGSVVLTTAQDVVTGDKGDYSADTGLAVMTGDVKLTRGNNQLNGGYAEVNMKTGISRLFAAPPGTTAPQRVQGVFVPGDAKKAEGAAPAVTPKPAASAKKPASAKPAAKPATKKAPSSQKAPSPAKPKQP